MQESLNNVVRHAPGASADVAVTIGADCCDIRITNATAATPDPYRTGNGIIGMRERASSLGGTLLAGPADAGHAWRVHAQFPLAER